MKIIELPFLAVRHSILKPPDLPTIVSWTPSPDRKYAVCSGDDGYFFFVADPRSIE